MCFRGETDDLNHHGATGHGGMRYEHGGVDQPQPPAPDRWVDGTALRADLSGALSYRSFEP
jgi:hypothetical protein